VAIGRCPPCPPPPFTLPLIFISFHPRSVRCKRKNATFFVRVKTTQTIGEVKQEISDALSCSSDESSPSSSSSAVPPQKMRIYATDKDGSDPLPNTATLADHEIANDAILYVVFRRAGKEDVEDATADADDDCWEAIEVETGEME
jgi:hypothetical protein